MKPDILEDLLHQELRSLYCAEKQMCQALAKMAQAACHPKVRELLKAFLGGSEEHAGRLERMAALIGQNLVGTKCPCMKQLIEDEARESLLNAHARHETYDAGLISAVHLFICHEIERHELATMLASRLGLEEVELLMRENLNEQKVMEARLTRLAKSLKNSSRSHQGAAFIQGAHIASKHRERRREKYCPAAAQTRPGKPFLTRPVCR